MRYPSISASFINLTRRAPSLVQCCLWFLLIVPVSVSAGVSYQWALNGTNIPNATNATLTLTGGQTTNAGNYSVLVSNLSGAASSATVALTVSNAPTGVALPSGAIAWWRAESNYLDSVGSNNGTAKNGLGFAPGEVGSAFNVSNGQYLVVNPAFPSALDMGQAAGFTFEEWIKPATVSAEEMLFQYERVLGSYVGSDEGIELNIKAVAPGGVLHVNLVDTNFVFHEFLSPTNLLAAGVWQHVALTYDKTSGLAALYVNGAEVVATNIGSITLHTSYTNLLLGARTYYNSVSSPGARYTGLIDESTIYNRALASNEIAAIYTAGSNGKLATNTGTAPVITAQPTSEVVVAGGTASFAVTATGTAPLSYQWLFNGTNLFNATNTTLTLAGVQAANAGNYSVVVTNLYGLISSATAALAVSNAPTGVALPSGAIAWWRAESNYLDSVGSNNGTAKNGLNFAPGEVGSAFNVSNGQYLVVNPASPSALDMGQAAGFTFEEWIKPATVSADQILFEYERVLGTYTGTDVGIGFDIHPASPGGILYANLVETNFVAHEFAAPASLLAAGVWQHVALTYDKASGLAAMYVNGTEVVTTNIGSITLHTSYTNLLLGARTTYNSVSSPGARYTGLMDEVTIYNRALASNEIAAIYTAGSNGKLATNTGTAPVITAQPTSEVVLAGGTASFAVTATGTAPLSYQWLFNGTNLFNATNTTLTLAGVQAANAGNYSVVVTNLYGLISSATAALTVSNAPTGVALPSGAIAWWRAESNYLDSVGSNNGTAKNGLNFAPGEVGSAFNVSNGQYLVVNPASPSALDMGQAAGFTFEEWIKPATVSADQILFEYERVLGTYTGTDVGIGFDIHPASPGGILYANLVETNFVAHEFAAPASLLAAGVWQHVALTYDKASGLAAMYVNGTEVVTTNIGSITLHTSYTNLLLGARTTYNSVSSPGARYTGLMDEVTIYNRALASNEIAAIYTAGSNGKLATNTGTAPVITAQPTSEVVVAGGTASFAVTATGTAPLSYQWLFNGTNLFNATNTTLTLAGVQAANTGNYSVVVTNLYGSISSATAALTVSNAPTGVALPSGAIAWWRAESNYLDSVGSNNGTAKNGLNFAPGEVGSAFNVSNGQYLVVNPAFPSALDMGQAAGFTFEEWIKPATVSADQILFEYERVLGTYTGTDVGIGFDIHPASPGGILYANLVETNFVAHEFAAPASLLAAGVWQHVALTYDKASGLAAMYVNGTEVVTTNIGSITLHTSYTNLLLGARTTYNSVSSPGARYTGLMDEVTIYNRALASNEIAAIYTAGSNGKLATNTGTAPVITAQPTSEVVLAGGTASFAVTATGTAPLSYQWLFNGTNLFNATNTTLTLAGVQAANAGNYSVVVTNLYGLISSATAALTVSNAPTGVALPSGAIAWWRAESNYLDSVGSNNGTAKNGLGFAPGEVGSAFNVSNGQYLVVNPAFPSALDMGQAAGFTFEEWIKPATVSADQILFEYERVLGTYTGTDVGIGFDIHPASPGGILYANLVETNFVAHEFAAPASLLAAGVWQHVALTYDKASGLAAMYVNGTEVVTTNIGSITLHTSYTNLLLGARTTYNSVSSPGARYTGLMDEVTVYNRALASNEIAAIYTAGSNGKLATTSTNSIVSVAGVIDHFTWSQIASPRFANTPFTVTVQAKNSQNEVCSNFTGTAVLTTTNGVEVSPSVAASFSQGVWTGAAIISQPGTNLVLKASDNASHVGVANAITVTARPTLSLTPSNNSLVFSWPAADSDFAVEATTNLSSGQWSTIDATSSVVGNQHEQVLPISNTNQLFFRLRYTAP